MGATPERIADAERSSRRMLDRRPTVTMNLVGDSTLPASFWMRHFVDSAQLLWVAPEGRTWADLGAGAGLPGIVLAILLKGREGAHAHLVESMTKRCGFLGPVVVRGAIATGDGPSMPGRRACDLKVDRRDGPRLRSAGRACSDYAPNPISREARGDFLLKGREGSNPSSRPAQRHPGASQPIRSVRASATRAAEVAVDHRTPVASGQAR